MPNLADIPLPPLDARLGVHVIFVSVPREEVIFVKVLLESFEIRRGSGGAGRHRGGEGAIRRLRFLKPMTAAILSNHRRVAPHGMAGGHPGAPGHNYVLRAAGGRLELGPTDRTDMTIGDVFVVETPGGGGYGA